jgi:hypothetical protein
MIKVGKTYATRNEHPFTCIAVDNKFAYMHSCKGGIAYTWLVDSGKSVSLDFNYDLVIDTCFKEVAA